MKFISIFRHKKWYAIVCLQLYRAVIENFSMQNRRNFNAILYLFLNLFQAVFVPFSKKTLKK